MDLISRQAAIDGIESFRPIKPTRGETSMEAVNRSAWDCAINCVESFIRTMPPSAQPEPIKINIDHELTKDEYEKLRKDMADAPIVLLPSAQPEVIRCKDCKHRDPEDKKCDCGHDIVWQLPRNDDWFCADGERKDG